MPPMRFLDSWVFVDPKYKGLQGIVYIQHTRKYMHAETLALLTKPLYFPNMKYLEQLSW
jgi:hypothetical protein